MYRTIDTRFCFIWQDMHKVELVVLKMNGA